MAQDLFAPRSQARTRGLFLGQHVALGLLEKLSLKFLLQNTRLGDFGIEMGGDLFGVDDSGDFG